MKRVFQLSPISALLLVAAFRVKTLSWSFTTCCGSCAQDYYGTIGLVPNATGLLTRAGHSTTPCIPALYDGDTFRDTSAGTAVKFMVGSDGTAESVWMHSLEKTGRNAMFLRIS
jgi:hypothetical protein